jgi:hypothetical protein
VNPRTCRAALYAIGLIAMLASANALAHSYAGLYDWAVHHRLSGWQARSWPAEIDVFLAVGELALYVAYLDGWPARQRIWPWTTALTGLAVSIAGNVGHIQAVPGHPVILADRLTAATSPVAAFAGLSVGLLVLKMTRQRCHASVQEPRIVPALVLAPPPPGNMATGAQPCSSPAANGSWAGEVVRYRSDRGPRPGALRADAAARLQAATPIAGEAPAQRLSRWRSVFARELADLDQAILAASSQGRASTISDIDLRSAVYLAGRLLATLYDVTLDQVTP